MASFVNFIKDIAQVDCYKQATLTAGAAVIDGDTITLPTGTTVLSSYSLNGSFIESGDLILTINKIVEDEWVVLQFPDIGPYIIDYLNGSDHYYEPIYFDCNTDTCDDCYSCGYMNKGRLYNKKVNGLLVNSNYQVSHPDYMLEFTYDEDNSKILMNDNNFNGTLYENYEINEALYSKFLILTYLSYNVDTGKFIEQIVYSSGIQADTVHEWEYDITLDATRCWYHNSECIEVEDDFTNATVIVEYVGDNNTYLTATRTYPILYTDRPDTESGKKYVDGIYKSYYFMVRNILLSNTYTLAKGNVVRLNILGVDYTLRATYDYQIITTTTTITVNKIGSSDTTGALTSVTIDDILEWFTLVEGTIDDELTYTPMEVLNSITDMEFCGTLQGTSVLQPLLAEENHIITYELGYEILDSIEDCSVPCERFSFDEWIGLRQKHLAANTAFCQGDIMKAALQLYTSRKRCKNC